MVIDAAGSGRWMSLLLSLVLALAVNIIAEWLLAVDTDHPWQRLTPKQRTLRILRWLMLSVGLLALAAMHVSVHHTLAFALFSVTAATDFETRLLPPDRYTYGCVIVGIALASVSGTLGFRDAVVAEAICFAVVTLSVAFFDGIDSGDIKMAMQFGAACGSLSVVGISVLMMAVVAALIPASIFILRCLQRQPLRLAAAEVAHLSAPLAAIAWVGLLAAFVWMALI